MMIGFHPNSAVIVVDPISTGANLAQLLYDRGWNVIRVFSDGCPEKVKAHTPAGLTVKFVNTIEHFGDLAATVASVRATGYELAASFVGCETGVLFSDILTDALGLRGNATAHSELRRNKFLQTEAVRTAGLPAAHQALVSTQTEVEAFLTASSATLSAGAPFKAVVKPVDGAGSDGVSICDSADEVRRTASAISGPQLLPTYRVSPPPSTNPSDIRRTSSLLYKCLPTIFRLNSTYIRFVVGADRIYFVCFAGSSRFSSLSGSTKIPLSGLRV